MRDQQKQGMGLIEQGMQQIIDLQVKPQVDAVNKDIKAARDEFGKIKEEADKSLAEAKNLVESTISGEIDGVKKEVSGELQEKQKYIDNLVKRMQELEKAIQGKVDMCVHNDSIGDDKTIKFTVPNKTRAIQYYIGGQQHRAKLKENGSFKGPHITESSVSGSDHTIKLNQKLDDGTSFSIDFDTPSVFDRIYSLEEKLLSIEKTLGGLCDVLNNFAKNASK